MAARESAGGGGVEAMVAATPVTRERYVDFLRALSILAVILGHWIVSTIFWQDGRLYLGNAVGLAPGLWILTWVFQVMPIFFFVGGFSNYVAYESSERRGEPVWTFVRRRIARLLWPAAPFFAIWGATQIALHSANVGAGTSLHLWGGTRLLRGMDPPASTLPFGPLWFLAVYLIVVAISPLTIRLHRRFRWAVPAVLVAGTFAADIVGFGVDGMRWARYLNIAFILLLPHQLGHFYGDGTLLRLPRKVFWGMALGGYGLLIVLTTPWFFDLIGSHARFDWFPGIGHYPKSMIGTGTESVSNAYPPTLCYMAQAIGSIGVAMLFRERASRWLLHPRPWKVVVLLNSVIMTLFLWFMTAYMIAILALWPLGFGRQHAINPRWWLERPLWVLLPGMILVGLVALFGKWERRTHGSPRKDTGSKRRELVEVG